MRNEITTIDIESIVSRKFGIRQNLIVPNVSWGLDLRLHECDLLILSSSGYATEIEIKVSKSDLIKDSEKSHGHRSDLIKYLYFAIPSHLAKYIDYIPLRAGIFVITTNRILYKIKNAERNKNAKQFDDNLKFKLARLGAMRVWGLKDTIIYQKAHIEDLKNRLIVT